MAHTPGPWTADSYTPGHDDEGDPMESQWRVRTPGEEVCSGIQVEADARLIASSPELLAACQSVLDEFPALDSRRIESVKSICRAAIAKATGGTHD